MANSVNAIGEYCTTGSWYSSRVRVGRDKATGESEASALGAKRTRWISFLMITSPAEPIEFLGRYDIGDFWIAVFLIVEVGHPGVIDG